MKWAWMACLMLLLAWPATAQQTRPEDTVKAFMLAVANTQDKAAWNQLTDSSKQQIVDVRANTQHTDPAAVRQKLDGGDAAALADVFGPFRQGFDAQQAENGHYTLKSLSGNDAVVSCDVGGPVDWRLSLDGGVWKLGLMETLFPSAPATAVTPAPDPAAEAASQAVRDFLQAMIHDDYVSLWNALTPQSQDAFVDLVVDKVKAKPTDVRKAFETGQPMADFWSGFKEKSDPATLAQGQCTATVNGDVAQVTIQVKEQTPVVLQVYRIGDTWRIGWSESFFKDGKP